MPTQNRTRAMDHPKPLCVLARPLVPRRLLKTPFRGRPRRKRKFGDCAAWSSKNLGVSQTRKSLQECNRTCADTANFATTNLATGRRLLLNTTLCLRITYTPVMPLEALCAIRFKQEMEEGCTYYALHRQAHEYHCRRKSAISKAATKTTW